MKKFYTRFLVALAAIVLAIPASAAVEGVASLFGTYRMTANVEIIDQAYKDQLSGDCEVKIIADPIGIYACEIDGLFGIEDSYQQVSKMGEMEDGKQALKITNPNGGGWDAWGTFDGWMTEADGSNPFGTDNYGPLYYTLNEDGSVITIPDFSFVKMNTTFTDVDGIIAKFTNVKLTLIKKEEIEVADISGLYHFTPSTDHNYEVVADFPTEFDMTLVNKGDNKAYNVTMSWPNLGDLTLEGKFDGSALTIAFENAKVGAYSVVDSYENVKSNITFNLVGENLKLTSGILFNNEAEQNVYWVGGGLAKKDGEDPEVPSYVGTYKATATIVAHMDGTPDTPTEGDIVIEYDESLDMYFITSFLGYDTYTLNYGGIEFRPDADDPSKGYIVAEVNYSYLQFLEETAGGDYKYLELRDVNGANSEIPVTFDEKGNMTIKDCSIFTTTYMGSEDDTFVTYYSPIVAAKEVETAVRTTAQAVQNTTTEYFNLSGMKTNANQKGIVLVKKNGKVMKVLKK